MTNWSTQELTRIGRGQELQLASTRLDGTLRPYVTMWVVQADDDVYVRSASGPTTRGSSARGPAERVASAPAASSVT